MIGKVGIIPFSLSTMFYDVVKKFSIFSNNCENFRRGLIFWSNYCRWWLMVVVALNTPQKSHFFLLVGVAGDPTGVVGHQLFVSLG